ncbi:MAG: tyrosine-type recombinase/integrase [Clostridiales Family XIII bacterium]|nr:tyrosine-type recombinase/integrase [Clostridia bacterium]MDY3010912.1 tyrosine-type recombinase/integrase [Clostridiales Family XIII bacterium]
MMIFKRRPTVAEWSKTWLELYKKGRIVEMSFLNYASMVELHILPHIGHKRVNKVCQADIMLVLNKLTCYSYSHIKRGYSAMNQIFNSAKENNLIKSNPAEGVLIPHGKGDGKRRSITDDERKSILELAETHRYGIWIKLLLFCGLRPGETGRIKKRHIDVENSLLYVDGTKSLHAKRKVPITDPDFLKELIAYAENLDEDDFLFTTEDGRPMTQGRKQFFWTEFKRDLSYYEPGLCPYCLRHTFCTDMQHAGVPITIAAKLMGHSDPKITARVYTHYTDESLNVAADLLKKYREPQE